METYWVYILQVSNGNYYTGFTADIRRRYREHLDGSGGCRYTRSFPPVKLVQCWRVFGLRGTALRIEHYVKKKPRATKEQLIRHPDMLIRMLDHSGITREGFTRDSKGADSIRADSRCDEITCTEVVSCSADIIDEVNTYNTRKTPGKRR